MFVSATSSVTFSSKLHHWGADHFLGDFGNPLEHFAVCCCAASIPYTYGVCQHKRQQLVEVVLPQESQEVKYLLCFLNYYCGVYCLTSGCSECSMFWASDWDTRMHLSTVTVSV